MEIPRTRSQEDRLSWVNMSPSRRRFLLATAAGAGVHHCGPLLAVVVPSCPSDGAGESLLAQDRRLRMQVLFHNPFPRELHDQCFWCYLPMTVSGQMLSQVTASVEHQVTMDAWGHQVLSLRFDRFPAYGSQTVGISVLVRKNEMPCAHVSDDPRRWLRPGPFVESDAPEILTLGHQLHRPTAMETLRSIYHWVKGEMSYEGYVPQDRGALHALRTRMGDCTEYAALVVALSRANGVPARMLGGYVVDRDALLRATDYHNWAEVLLDGGWCILDAQKGQWMPSHKRYVPFEIYRDQVTNDMGSAHRYRVEGDVEVAV